MSTDSILSIKNVFVYSRNCFDPFLTFQKATIACNAIEQFSFLSNNYLHFYSPASQSKSDLKF